MGDISLPVIVAYLIRGWDSNIRTSFIIWKVHFPNEIWILDEEPAEARSQQDCGMLLRVSQQKRDNF